MQRVAYDGLVRLNGEEHETSLSEAGSYAGLLLTLGRFDEAKSLSRKTVPLARRIYGDSHEVTLKMRWLYAQSFYMNPGATLDDLREAVTTLEDAERIARRVFGGSHPLAVDVERCLRDAQVVLHFREANGEA